jgi:hypothetical protein
MQMFRGVKEYLNTFLILTMNVSGQLHTLYPGIEPQLPIQEEDGWVQQPVRMLWNRQNSLAPV